MNNYEFTQGLGDTISCDECDDITENWWTGESRAICGDCYQGMNGAKADTITGNLKQLLELAGKVADTGLGIELHRLYVDLSEGIADLGIQCKCDCSCQNIDDYTLEGTTCEDCFRDCSEITGDGKCDHCATTYDVGSQIDHCGECGTCWEHCGGHKA